MTADRSEDKDGASAKHPHEPIPPVIGSDGSCTICRMLTELSQWRTWGIVEIAIRNPNVKSYVEHWEGRALKAEAALSSSTPISREAVLEEAAICCEAQGRKSQTIDGQSFYIALGQAALAIRALKSAVPEYAQSSDNEQRQARASGVSPIDGCSGRDPRASSDDTSPPASTPLSAIPPTHPLVLAAQKMLAASDQFVRDTGLKDGDALTDAAEGVREALKRTATPQPCCLTGYMTTDVCSPLCIPAPVSSTTPARILPPVMPNGKRSRLFYWEETEDAWCPAETLEVENIIDYQCFTEDGEEQEIRFKRQDMTDAEFEAIPEG